MKVFLFSLSLLVLLLLPTAVFAAERPNILWIFVEDLSPWIGCYGDEINKEATPNIDALAARGVRFDRCYMPAPVCSACRSALITGVMQTTTGTHNHRFLSHARLRHSFARRNQNHSRDFPRAWLRHVQSRERRLQFCLQKGRSLFRWIAQRQEKKERFILWEGWQSRCVVASAERQTVFSGKLCFGGVKIERRNYRIRLLHNP